MATPVPGTDEADTWSASMDFWRLRDRNVERSAGFERRFESRQDHRPTLASALQEMRRNRRRVRFGHRQAHEIFADPLDLIGDDAFGQLGLDPIDIPCHDELPG